MPHLNEINHTTSAAARVANNLDEYIQYRNNNHHPAASESNVSYPLYITNTVPVESFHTTDEPYLIQHGVDPKKLITHDRGTACCVRILNPNNTGTALVDIPYLLVGVSHTKINKWKADLRDKHNISFALRQYHSRFYAFEPVPPYRVVGRSGQFCMPFPASSSSSSSSSEQQDIPSLSLIRNQPLQMGDNHTCPYITFVMGIVDAVDDPTGETVVMSYGMNDCGARVVKVTKSSIFNILFPNATYNSLLLPQQQ